MSIKLNVGASPIWDRLGWHIVDHKPSRGSQAVSMVSDASNIPLPDESCETVFCSHVVEHIPNVQIKQTLREFNRVLEVGGILRLLTPDLFKIASAYAAKDEEFFRRALDEDESIRTDMGFGGMLANWVVAPGQDVALFDCDLRKLLGGLGHLYLYDFDMLKILLSSCGFSDIRQKGFCESEHPEYLEPLHVVGQEPVWHNLNQAFYKKNGLVHYYDSATGRYNINFLVTGFDRDPLTSLIVECRKEHACPQDFDEDKGNYNRYGRSLMRRDDFRLKCRWMLIASRLAELWLRLRRMK